MFQGAVTFNQDISNWDVSNVQDMSNMFAVTFLFNKPLSNWERDTSTLSNVTNISGMFYTSKLFNQNIGNWDISNVQDMSGMFQSATSFNNGGSPSISGWSTGNVTDMSHMFDTATGFTQSISPWIVTGVTNFNGFMAGKSTTNYSVTNYDKILNSWSNQNVNTDLTIDFGSNCVGKNNKCIKYSLTGKTGRDILTGGTYSWTIIDGGQYSALTTGSLSLIDETGYIDSYWNAITPSNFFIQFVDGFPRYGNLGTMTTPLSRDVSTPIVIGISFRLGYQSTATLTLKINGVTMDTRSVTGTGSVMTFSFLPVTFLSTDNVSISLT
jgi:surface protein